MGKLKFVDVSKQLGLLFRGNHTFGLEVLQFFLNVGVAMIPT